MRLRILFGTLALILGLALYALAVAALGDRFLAQHGVAETLFYALAGIAWIWPAARLTRWMQRAAPHRPPMIG
jgi:DNA-directed RNA polymerase specialized sigma24 family protein